MRPKEKIQNFPRRRALKNFKLFNELRILQQKSQRRALRARRVDTPGQLLLYAARYNKTKRLHIKRHTLSYLIDTVNLRQTSGRGSILAMCLFAGNVEQDLNLSPEQIDYILKNSDVTRKNRYGDNLFQYALYYNNVGKLYLNRAQFDYLMRRSRVYMPDSVGSTALQIVLRNNLYDKLYFSFEQLDYLISHSNLNHLNIDNECALDIALQCSKHEWKHFSLDNWHALLKGTNLQNIKNIHWRRLPPDFGFEQIDYLIRGINLNHIAQKDRLPIMSMLQATPDLKLSNAQWDYVLKNTNLLTLAEKHNYWTPLMFAIYHRHCFYLTDEQWEYFMEQCPLDIHSGVLMQESLKIEMMSFYQEHKSKQEKKKLESKVIMFPSQLESATKSIKKTLHKI